MPDCAFLPLPLIQELVTLLDSMVYGVALPGAAMVVVTVTTLVTPPGPAGPTPTKQPVQA